MATSTLNHDEFAIKTRTVFKLQTVGPVITIDNSGQLCITLKYNANTAYIQANTTPNPVDIEESIGDSGVFDPNTKISFDDLTSLPKSFVLDYDAGNDIIWLEASRPAFNLTTTAEKGRQGDSLRESRKKN